MSTPRTERLAALRVTLRSALELCAADLADVHTLGKTPTRAGQAALARLGLVQVLTADVQHELEREQGRGGGR